MIILWFWLWYLWGWTTCWGPSYLQERALMDETQPSGIAFQFSWGPGVRRCSHHNCSALLHKPLPSANLCAQKFQCLQRVWHVSGRKRILTNGRTFKLTNHHRLDLLRTKSVEAKKSLRHLRPIWKIHTCSAFPTITSRIGLVWKGMKHILTL